MKKVITTEKVPIKMWLDNLEAGALIQAKNLANLPFVFKHIAIMPDAHQGFGMPIGGVMATKDFIVPNAVGVDIGCGMCAVKTSLTDIDHVTLKNIMGEIRKVIPVGFSHQQREQDDMLMPNANNIPEKGIVLHEWNNALTQIGTLGGGNHFIEIQKGDDGFIWIMIHSGSRNIGYKVAKHYNILAQELNVKWQSEVPKGWGLAFLPIDSKEGQDYLGEMNYCVDFALANRKLMMDRIRNVLWKEVGNKIGRIKYCETINIAHNYASLESHFGKNVWVHRKGATLAREKTVGIIPGSQGSCSYIVQGKGNKDSFESCSHGAGRRMGRKQAKIELNLQEEIDKMNELGVIHSIRTRDELDEAVGAYKDIKEVMKNQEDLVEILVELKPLAVIKG